MPLRHCRKGLSTALWPVLKGNEKGVVTVNLHQMRNQAHCWNPLFTLIPVMTMTCHTVFNLRSRSNDFEIEFDFHWKKDNFSITQPRIVVRRTGISICAPDHNSSGYSDHNIVVTKISLLWAGELAYRVIKMTKIAISYTFL